MAGDAAPLCIGMPDVPVILKIKPSFLLALKLLAYSHVISILSVYCTSIGIFMQQQAQRDETNAISF